MSLTLLSFLNRVLWTNSLFGQLNPPHADRRPNEADIYRGTNSVKWEWRKKQNPSGVWQYKICVKRKQVALTHCIVTQCLLLR